MLGHSLEKSGIAKVDSNFGNSFNSIDKLNVGSILVSGQTDIGRLRFRLKIKNLFVDQIYCL